MKKLLLFFAAALVAMATGCEGNCTIIFEIENQTRFETIVEIDGKSDAISIMPNTKQLVRHISDLCDWSGLGEDDGYEKQNLVIADAKMSVGEKNIPNIIWTRQYWDYTKTAKYKAVYTLTITDELIEELLSTEEQ